MWTLVELGGVALELGVAESAPWIALDPEGRVSGSGGCNRLFGSFAQDGDALRFGDVATTRMACAEPIMRREAAFLAALEETRRFELDGNALSAFAGGRRLARFVSAPRAG